MNSTVKLVVYVASWSGEDDAIRFRAERFREGNPKVEVHILDADSGRFELMVPGVGPVYHTPVVGRWTSDGLYECASGATGRSVFERAVCGEPK